MYRRAAPLQAPSEKEEDDDNPLTRWLPGGLEALREHRNDDNFSLIPGKHFAVIDYVGPDYIVYPDEPLLFRFR